MKGLGLLRKIAEKNNLKGYGMARALGVPLNTYYYMVRDSDYLILRVLVKLKKFFGLSWPELGKLIEKDCEGK